jgi:hypothetical protein
MDTQEPGGALGHSLMPHGGWGGMWGYLTWMVILIPLLGCATTGSTFGAGVGDRVLDGPPYYNGLRSLPLAGRVAHFPIDYQSGAEQEAIFEPAGGAGTPIAALLDDMNAFLDELRGAPSITVPSGRHALAPDVTFSCEPRGVESCELAWDRDGDDRRSMLLAVRRPSQAWIETNDRTLDEAGAQYVLVITLEIANYPVYQKNWRGDKVVRLGTGHSQKVPWITSLDQPVQVLQLTGALIDREGRAARIGAEGLIARRTNILLTAVGAQELISDADIERLVRYRRLDLSGEPLAWQVSINNLVKQLTGEGVLR